MKNNSESIAQASQAMDSSYILQALLDTSKQMVFLLDAHWNLAAINSQGRTGLKALTGKLAKEGAPFLDFMPNQEEGYIRNAIAEAFQGQAHEFVRSVQWENRLRWLGLQITPVKQRGKIDAVVIYVDDVTDEKEAEETLEDLELSFQSVFEHVAVGLMFYSHDFKLLHANNYFYEMLGYTREEYSALPTWQSTHPEDVDKSKGMAQRLINGELDNYSIEKRYISRSGQIIWVILTATIVKDAQDVPRRIISVIQDITDRKKAEEELLFKKQELDTFVYRASHDLKGPVASLKGLYGLVKHEFSSDEKAMGYFDHYNNNVNRLHGIIQDLLDLTKIKDLEANFREVDLQGLVNSCLDSLQHLPRFEHISFDVKVNLGGTVRSDEALLRTIVQNLIENTIKYSSAERDPMTKVRVSSQDQMLKIEVKDNGIGIDKEHQDKVFHMFFRATEQATGSGLGLYLVKNAIDKLKGSIEISSKPGKGTTFRAFIPYSEDNSAQGATP